MLNFTANARFRFFTTAALASFYAMLSVSTVLQASEATIELLLSPAETNSSLSRVVADQSGQVYLSWVSQEEDMASLTFSELSKEGWTTPETISQGSNWFINWADFPVLSVNDGNKAAHWLRKSASGTYDYDIDARFYDAKKGHWSEANTIHNDGVSAEHGFVSMLPLDTGNTLITWLDGRNTSAEDDHGAMTLRAGIFDAKGSTLNEWELDQRVCDCCQTSSAMTDAGPIVVYRNRSDDEIRDIYMTRYSAGTWSQPQAIHNDNWQIAGCPVNGPAIAAKGPQVAVAWFTAKDDNPKVLLALSTDDGETFSAPIVVSSPQTNGRVDTTILDSGRIAVSWLDTSNAEAKLMLSLYSAQGKLVDATEIASTSASRRSGFPIIEGVGDVVYLTWTDITAEPRVRVARISY